MAADGTTHTFHDEAREIVTPALAPFFQREVAKEREWLSEMRRSSGACFSGFADTTRKPRTNRDMIRDAQIEQQRAEDGREAYLASYLGKARKSIADGCRAAEQLHARLHDVGSALSRGDGSATRKAEDAQEALRDLRRLVGDMEAFVRLAGAA